LGTISDLKSLSAHLPNHPRPGRSKMLNRKTKHFLFFRRYPKVLPGSVIKVPESDGQKKQFLSMTEVLTLLTALTAMVTIYKLL